MANLNFKQTLDDADFRRKLIANQDFVRDTINKGATAANTAVAKTGKETTKAVGGISKSLAGVGGKIAATFSTAALVGFAKQVANVRGEFQKLEVAFSTMVGLEKGTKLMEDAVAFAAKTPFDLQGVANGAKQLLAYGSAAEEVMGELKMLGDIAAGLSMPLGDLVYLYGTTRTQGRLFTMDLRQFMGRGIPLAEELAKQFGVTKDKVGELVTEGKVGFEHMRKGLQAMTGEGGKFYNLMDAQSKTIAGKMSNLGDSIQQMFNDIGKKSEGVIGKTLEGASFLVENYEKLGRVILDLIKIYGAYKVAVMAGNVLMDLAKHKAVGMTAAAYMQTRAQLALAVAQEKVNKSFAANPYVLAAVAVTALAVAIYKVAKATDPAKVAAKEYEETLSGIAEAENRRKEAAEPLLATLKDQTKTDGQRADAMRKLVAEYPALLAMYDAEKLALMSIQDVEGALAKAREKERKKALDDKYADVLREIVEVQGKIDAVNPMDRWLLVPGLERQMKALELLRDKLYPEVRKAGTDMWNALTPDNVKLEALSASIANIKSQLSELDAIRLNNGGQLNPLQDAQWGLLKDKLRELTDQQTILSTMTNEGADASVTAAEAIAQQRAEVERLQKAYDDLQKTDSSTKFESKDKYLEAVDSAKNALDKAQKNLATMQGVAANAANAAADYAAKMAQAHAELLQEMTDTDLAEADARVAAEEEILRQILALEDGYASEVLDLGRQLEDKRIDMMDEGLDKRLKELATAEKRELKELEAWRDDKLKALGLEELPGEAKEVYEAYYQTIKEFYDSKKNLEKGREAKKNAPYAGLFGDLSHKTVSDIRQLIEAAETAIADGTAGSAADIAELQRRIEEAYDAIEGKNPWKALQDGMKTGDTSMFNTALEGITAQFGTMLNLAEQLGKAMGQDWTKPIEMARAGVEVLAQAFKKVDADDLSSRFSKITGLISAIVTAASTAFGVVEGLIMKGVNETDVRLADLEARITRIAKQRGAGDSLFTTDKINAATRAIEAFNTSMRSTAGSDFAAELRRVQGALFDVSSTAALLPVGNAVSKYLGKRNKEAKKFFEEFNRYALNNVEDFDAAIADVTAAAERNKGKIGKTYLNELKTSLELAKQSLQDYESAVKDMVGDIGDGLLDAIRTARREGLDAVTEIGKALSTSLESILEGNIWASTMGPVFNAFTDNLKDALGTNPTLSIEEAFAELFAGIDGNTQRFYDLTDKAKEMAASIGGISVFGTDQSYEAQIEAQEAYLRRMEGIAATREEVEARVAEERRGLLEEYAKYAQDIEAYEQELQELRQKDDAYIVANMDMPEEEVARMQELERILRTAQELKEHDAMAAISLSEIDAADAAVAATRARIEALKAEKEAYEQTYPYLKEQLQEVEEQIERLTKAQIEDGTLDALKAKKAALEEEAKWFEDRINAESVTQEESMRKTLGYYQKEIDRLKDITKDFTLEDLADAGNKKLLDDLKAVEEAYDKLNDALYGTKEPELEGPNLFSIEWYDAEIRRIQEDMRKLTPEEYMDETIGGDLQAQIDRYTKAIADLEAFWAEVEDPLRDLTEGSEDWLQAKIAAINGQLSAMAPAERLGDVGKALEAEKQGYQELIDTLNGMTKPDPTSLDAWNEVVSSYQARWRALGQEAREGEEGRFIKDEIARYQELIDKAESVKKETVKGSADWIRDELSASNAALDAMNVRDPANAARVAELKAYIASLEEMQAAIDEALNGKAEATMEDLVSSAKARQDLMDKWVEAYGEEEAKTLMDSLAFDPDEYERTLKASLDELKSRTLTEGLNEAEQATYDTLLSQWNDLQAAKRQAMEDRLEEEKRAAEEAARATWEAWEETFNALDDAAEDNYRRLELYQEALAKLPESGLGAEQVVEAVSKIGAAISGTTKAIEDHLYGTYKTAAQEHADALKANAQDVAYIERLLLGELTEGERSKWTELLASARKQRKEVISDYARAEIESAEQYDVLFGDLTRVSVAQAREALTAYRAIVDANEDLTEEVRNEILGALKDVEAQIDEIAEGQSLERIEGKFNDITASIDALSSVLDNLGIGAGLVDGLQGVRSTVDGIRQLVTATSFSTKIGAIAAVLNGIINVAKAVKGVFGNAADELTAGVKALANEYDRLEREVSKTYGQTAIRGQRAMIDNLKMQIVQYDRLIDQEGNKNRAWWDIFGLFSGKTDEEKLKELAADKEAALDKIAQMEADLKDQILQTDAESFSNSLNEILRRSYDDIDAFYSDMEALVTDSIENIIAESIRQTFVVEQANAALDKLYRAGMTDIAQEQFANDIRAITARAKEEYDRWKQEGWFTDEESSTRDNAGTISRAISEQTATWIKGALQNINVKQADMLNVQRSMGQAMQDSLSDLVLSNKRIEANTAVLHDINAKLDGIARNIGTGRELR